MSEAKAEQAHQAAGAAEGHGNLHLRLLADIARDLSGEVTFPTTLDLAIRMRNAFRDPNIDPRAFERIVEMEPIIASKLLHLANIQAGASGGEWLSDLDSAIRTLGLPTARTAALAIAMEQIMKSRHLAAFERYASLNWEHSIRTAAIARCLARHCGRVDPEEALLAGLVHDIGVYYLFYRASEYQAYRDDKQALIELVVGWHESIGESVLHALGLPAKIVQAVHDHDNPRLDNLEPRTLGDVVYIANLLAGSAWEWTHQPPSIEQQTAMARTAQRYAFARDEAEGDIADFFAALGKGC